MTQHQHQCATNYFAHIACDCSADALAAKDAEIARLTAKLAQCRENAKRRNAAIDAVRKDKP